MKKKKKWKDIRSAIVMMCVMLAMLSSATFAWFSLTSNPVVNGLQMTAASSEGLKISKNNTTWFNAIDMNELNTDDGIAALETFTGMYPATLTTKTLYTAETATAANASSDLVGKPQFLAPKYTGFTVDGTTVIKDKTELAKYVASCTYYLKNENSSGTASIGIITADQESIDSSNIGVTDGNPNVEGSFVKLITDGDGNDANAGNDHSAVEAIRIALVIDNSKVVVYEPNSGTTLKSTSTYAINGLGDTNVTPDVVSLYEDGTIADGDDDATNNVKVSGELFTINANSSVQVDMYVWFEGQDDQCVDQIMKDLIEVQLQFTDLTASGN